MMATISIKWMSHHELRKLVGQSIRYFVRWSEEERFGLITRVNGDIIWCGAYCYHRDDLQSVRELAA